jgi:1-phosphofructokinase family hexose kinase
MLLCISTNPAIDRTLVIPGFSTGKVQRAVREYVSAGGKGLNVARAARALGHEALCMGPLGGHHGRLLMDLLATEGLPGAFTWLEHGETRTCTIVLDDAGSEPTVLNTVGPTVTPMDWGRLTADILRQAHNSSAALFSGSLPPGVSLDRYTALFAVLRQSGCVSWVDASGAPLHAALDNPPFGIKVNAREIGEALGRSVEDLDAALEAAQAVRAHGAEMACVTLGKTGAVLATGQGVWRGIAPPMDAISNVGSGDTFLAGLAAALLEGRPYEEALRRAIAAGAANTLSPIPGQLRFEDFTRLLPLVQVE